MPQEDAQNIVDDLQAGFGESFGEISTRPEAEQLPKSKVTLKVTNAYLNRSTNGRKQASAVCTVLECSAGDEFKGHTYTKNWGLETEENIRWFKTDLTHLEVDPPKSPKDLVAIMSRLTGICFDASLSPNADDAYPPNCYINRNARRTDLEVKGEGAEDTAKATF